MSIRHMPLMPLLLAALAALAAVLPPAAAAATNFAPDVLVVKTYPDGIRDDGIAYLYRNHLSVFSFYLFAPDEPGDVHQPIGAPIDMQGVTLRVRLPQGVDAVGGGIVHGPGLLSEHVRKHPVRQAGGGDASWWEIPCVKGQIRYRFRAGRWGVDTKSVASRYHVYLFLEPGPGLARDTFELAWTFRRGEQPLAEGTSSIRLLPAPAGRRNPRRFSLWTGIGSHRKLLDARELDACLDLARECGATDILQAGVPFVILGDLAAAARSRIAAKGLSIIDMDTIHAALAPRREAWPSNAVNYTVDLTDTRFRPDGKPPHVPTLWWCPTMLATPDSEIFTAVTQRIGRVCAEGIRQFYIDLERDIYSQCFCEHCREAFARRIHADGSASLPAKALDLIDAYPLEWYAFRSWQTGHFFKAWKTALARDFPGIRIGLNDNISYPGVFTRGLGYGMIWFCEDPRFTDFGVDFHNPDTIKGGLEDIIRLDLRFRPQDSYGVAITKPVIARAGFFCDVNWEHFCTLSGKAWADARGEPFGCDQRGELLKLSIANMAALGARGVETSLAADITDARVINEADKGMAFVAEFEDLLLDGKRLPDDAAAVHDLTGSPSPYDAIGPKSYYDRMYFHGPAKQYGFVQYTVHAGGLDSREAGFFGRIFRGSGGAARLVSLFNWDLHQPKRLLVKIPGLPEGRYLVHGYRPDERFRVVRGAREWWSSDELAQGVSLDVPAADITGLCITTRSRPGYDRRIPDREYASGDKAPINRYAWRAPPPAEPDIRAFKTWIYDRNLKAIQQRRPDAIPKRDFKAAP